MTLIEFEAWVSDNYGELVRVAARRYRGDEERGREALHDQINRVLESPDPLLEARNPVGWVSNAIRLYALQELKVGAVHARLMEQFVSDLGVLGEDLQAAGGDRKGRRTAQRAAQRAAKRAAREGVAVPIHKGMDIRWDGPMPGIVRRGFQTERDDALFERRALRSQWESLWAAATRPVYGIERGHSYTQFGQEVVR